MDFYDCNYMEHLQGHTRTWLEYIRYISQERSGKDVSHEEFSLDPRLLPENLARTRLRYSSRVWNLDTVKQNFR